MEETDLEITRNYVKGELLKQNFWADVYFKLITLKETVAKEAPGYFSEAINEQREVEIVQAILGETANQVMYMSALHGRNIQQVKEALR